MKLYKNKTAVPGWNSGTAVGLSELFHFIKRADVSRPADR